MSFSQYIERLYGMIVKDIINQSSNTTVVQLSYLSSRKPAGRDLGVARLSTWVQGSCDRLPKQLKNT